MEEKEIKMNRKVKRLIVASILVCVSLLTGIIAGVKISSNGILNSTISSSEQLVKLLKEKWYSDIYYGKDCDEDILIDQFVGALSTGDKVKLDPYTYLIKNESSSSTIESGKLGITITFYYNYPVIIDVDKNGAANGKLQVGDIITKAGKNCKDEFSILDDDVNYSNILSLALGKPDENAFIKVARFDENNVLSYFDYEITLKKQNEVTNYAYIENNDIDDTLIVKLTGFRADTKSNNTYNQLAEILKTNPAKNLVIDIRDNGGGALSSVVNICDLLLPEDKLVTRLVYKNKKIVNYTTKSKSMYDYDKIIILQNGNTASASEILISTLLYYYPEKVVLVGNKSYGKGIAQSNVSILKNNYTLQYTCAKWLRPDGSWIGMRNSYYTEGYQLGFEPLDENIITKSDLLNKMEANNSYIFYKTSTDAFKIDKVASQNKFFFEVYNMIYNDNCRTDYYFDEKCLEAIKCFQSNNNLISDGNMNEDTFLYFLKLFYDERESFSKSHIEKAKDIIMGM